MHLRSLLATSALLLATALPAYAASGDGSFSRAYIGADYEYFHPRWSGASSGLDDSLNGADIHVGSRMGKYWGLELGYFDTFNGSNARLNGGTLDVLGYLPISALTDSSTMPGFELVGSGGVAVVHGKATGVGAFSSTDTQGRLGLGAQYWFNSNLNGRIMEHWQDLDFGGRAKDAWITSAGLNWSF